MLLLLLAREGSDGRRLQQVVAHRLAHVVARAIAAPLVEARAARLTPVALEQKLVAPVAEGRSQERFPLLHSAQHS